MTPLTRRLALLGLLAAPLAPAAAAPVSYRLDPEASQVRFTFTLAGLAQTGTMPIRSARVTIDPQRLAKSRIRVELDAAGARTPLDIATRSMTGPEILDTARYPTITFETTHVQTGADGRLSDGAVIHGKLTIRGVTQPISLTADLYRPPGTAPDDLATLSARIRGQISRNRFGASGFAGLVADRVGFDITAVVHADK